MFSNTGRVFSEETWREIVRTGISVGETRRNTDRISLDTDQDKEKLVDWQRQLARWESPGRMASKVIAMETFGRKFG